jgi:cell division protein ZapA
MLFESKIHSFASYYRTLFVGSELRFVSACFCGGEGLRDGGWQPIPTCKRGQRERQSEGSPTGAVMKTVKVEIYDQSYQLRGDLDEAYVNELASYVDAKMRSVAESTGAVDSARVAVLAALNITDELYGLRQRQSQIEGPLRERAQRCLALVEKALEQAG